MLLSWFTSVACFLQQADVDGNGTIDCDEFLTVSLHLKKISSREHLSEAFKYFDKDGSGFIEIDELKEALGEGDHGPNDQVIQEIISDVDVDKVWELFLFGSLSCFTTVKDCSSNLSSSLVLTAFFPSLEQS